LETLQVTEVMMSFGFDEGQEQGRRRIPSSVQEGIIITTTTTLGSY
jgi:hypothetical protein